MTKIVIPQKKKDKLNGWQRMDTAKEDEVIDIIDASGERRTDCKFIIHTDRYIPNDRTTKFWCFWEQDHDSDHMTPVVKPKYWMKVKLPLFK